MSVTLVGCTPAWEPPKAPASPQTVVLYTPGPGDPAPSIIETVDTAPTTVDGNPEPYPRAAFVRYQVKPGVHALQGKVTKVYGNEVNWPFSATLETEPGMEYSLEPHPCGEQKSQSSDSRYVYTERSAAGLFAWVWVRKVGAPPLVGGGAVAAQDACKPYLADRVFQKDRVPPN